MRTVRLCVALGGWLVAACGLVLNLDESARPDGGADADVDVDSDADLDTDVDSDSQNGSDTATASDSDSASDTDTETATDRECFPPNARDFRCGADGFSCTDPWCDHEGRCVEIPSDFSCLDGDLCTEDKCRPDADPDEAGCIHEPVVCELDECSDEVFCDSIEAGCVYVAPADLGLPCETAGAEGLCLPGIGCRPLAVDVDGCIDGGCVELDFDPCTTNTCLDGSCVVVGCQPGEACAPRGCIPWGG